MSKKEKLDYFLEAIEGEEPEELTERNYVDADEMAFEEMMKLGKKLAAKIKEEYNNNISASSIRGLIGMVESGLYQGMIEGGMKDDVYRKAMKQLGKGERGQRIPAKPKSGKPYNENEEESGE
jgi:hypothetical protein